jgi:hypothetical protein
VSRAVTLVVAPLGPVLLALFPLLSLFARNQTEVEVSVVWWPLVWCVCGALTAYGLALLVTRRVAKAGVLASVLVVAFGYYGVFSEQEPGALYSLLWVMISVVAIVLVLRTRRDVDKIGYVVAAGALALAVPQMASIVQCHAHHGAPAATDPRLWPEPLEKPRVAPGTPLPDIYLIMPDDYVRPDVLKQYFHYDDSAFVGELQKRGFALVEDGRSPYSYSEMNMASVLNLDYLSSFPDVLGSTSMDMRPIKRVIEDNRAARLLADLGYDYVHLDTDEVTFAGRNPGISPLASPDSFMSAWLQQSLLRSVGGPLGFDDDANNQRFRDSVDAVFNELAAVPRSGRPRFVVFHTLIPHDPYVFGADGGAVTFPSDADHTGEVGMRYYVGQLQHLNRLVLNAVDAILAHSTSQPVIVIQADEGFEVDPDLFGEAAAQDIRIKGISAFYLPGQDRAGLPDPPTSVNDLRFVFNRYLGTSYPMLEARSYPELDLLYDFEEIPVR